MKDLVAFAQKNLNYIDIWVLMSDPCFFFLVTLCAMFSINYIQMFKMFTTVLTPLVDYLNSAFQVQFL